MDLTGDRSKVRCCKEQYCIGTRNVRSMNQGKLEVVKQEMARVNIDIRGISELKCPGSYAILLSTALDFNSITSHIHNWVLFFLWLHFFLLFFLCIFSGVISPLISVAYWAPTDLGSSSFSILSFCLFILFMGFSRQEY